MIDVRIVCTHDALKTAETLMRLLEAEQHRVHLAFGRQAITALEEARTARDAVILIWSPDARVQTYMHEWMRNIEPSRLIELARTADCPKHAQRKAPVVEFSNWRGERGGRAWDALNDRLRVVARTMEPPKPVPVRAIAAMSVVTAVAMAGAITARVNTPFTMPGGDNTLHEEAMLESPTTEVGGPLNAFEPASMDDAALRFRRIPEMRPIEPARYEALRGLTDIEPQTLRDETLIERINALNPLRSLSDNEPRNN